MSDTMFAFEQLMHPNTEWYLQPGAMKLPRITTSSEGDIALLYPKGKRPDKKDIPPDLLDNPMTNLENYGPYTFIAEGKVKSREGTIDIREITPKNWQWHYDSLLNILKDGIYSDMLQKYFLNVYFGPEFEDFCTVTMSVMDYYFNLIMWRPLVESGTRIQPCHVFYADELTARYIKDYIDIHIIEDIGSTISNLKVNNMIADSLQAYHDIDLFANYLSNTLNLNDTAELMEADPVYRDALTASYKGLQVDRIKEAVMKNANISIDRIKTAKQYIGHDHCLVDAWRAREGINPKQYAEFTVGIGIKPNGRGGIFEDVVDTSFIGGGLKNPVHYFIESSTSRIAQIEKHKNVSKSGMLARIMGLNNMDTYLNPDPNYDCHSRNLIPVTITSDEFLKYLNWRYYRETPNGQMKWINYRKDKHLIGKTIYLRSPCTCASAARGDGVCFHCYGRLAYVNYNYSDGFGINIGRIASEYMTSKQTQKQLSAKHILEASVDKISWSEGFYTFFEMENTIIQMNSDLENPQDFKLMIQQDAIESDADSDSGDDDDSDNYVDRMIDSDEYVTEFMVVSKKTGETVTITTAGEEKLYITNELNGIIRKKANPTDDYITVPLSALKGSPLFYIKVQNNEISKTLIKLKNLFNRSNEVRGKQIPELLAEILATNIEGGMDISAIHYEVMLSNQIRDAEDVLQRPNWDILNPPYRILTLDEALTKNPSVTISLSYQRITRAFYDPLTFRKNGASFMDLFFMKHPMLVVHGKPVDKIEKKRKPGELYEPFTITDDPNKFTGDDNSPEVDGIVDVEE